MSTRTCSIDGCDKPHRARGWCSAHYDYWHHREMRLHAKDRYARAREARFEDAREMMTWGEHPDNIARRVGVSVDALAKQAQRWGAHDIATYLWRRAAA